MSGMDTIDTESTKCWIFIVNYNWCLNEWIKNIYLSLIPFVETLVIRMLVKDRLVLSRHLSSFSSRNSLSVWLWKKRNYVMDRSDGEKEHFFIYVFSLFNLIKRKKKSTFSLTQEKTRNWTKNDQLEKYMSVYFHSKGYDVQWRHSIRLQLWEWT